MPGASSSACSSPASAKNTARPNRAFPHLSPTDTPTLKDVARLIKDGKAKRVIVMAGAGISTAAGIPDFRSPGTGLYDNLQRYDLPYPEAIFDLDFLEERPEAFYTLAKELYPGNFKPTTSHYFFRLLQDKGLLHGCWTQNVDTLERATNIKDGLIVEAHGSFASATCTHCKKPYTKEEIKPAIMRGEVVRCAEKPCKGRRDALVKPDIVFFGEGLPEQFFSRMHHFSSCDLLLVLGTSLSVGPFNSLVHRVPSTCPRVLINLESVGEAERPGAQGFEFERDGARDVRWLGEADRGVEELCDLLGWRDELRRLKEEGWRELDAAEGKGVREEKEEGKGAEEKREEVVERVGEAAGEKEPSEEVSNDSKEVDALAQAVEGVSLEAQEDVDEDQTSTKL
ncbi:uncharacterized protein RHOBADRAFT_36306 [Rhodotorula graminis WP1]|uniref:NAD-dependent protein deacetylase n=1 Tax=Rhodotorula graminis (strain WP1) TaxID=578459 RepID=A0A194S7S5_RHOGW|nr:uncharacterized protein RHOBADRAFT_36306 [Rhodotorula graminis WP1]KPV75456.1 hypothetical protein RHOBADRAFT_36306 [Rhodotorula graminis WP1]